MSQTDLNVANASGAVVRADLNDHFQALATNSSGATAPGTTFPHQWWFDESTNDLNQRNAGNTAWILVARKDGSGWTPYRQASLLGILATKNSNVLAKTAAYTIVVADDGKLIDADATSAAFTVTLPTVASAGDGFIISVKKTDSSANAVTIDGSGAETIDGATTLVLGVRHDSALLRCDGTEWHILATSGIGPKSLHQRKTANYTAIAADNGKTIEFDSGSAVMLNLTAAATLGNGWHIWVKNSGVGTLTVDPNATEVIDDATTITAVQNSGFRINCDGTSFWTQGKVGGGALTSISNTAITAVTNIDVTGFAPGTHDNYEVWISNGKPASDAVILEMETSTDGGTSFDTGVSDYTWAGSRSREGSTGTDEGDADDSEIQLTQLAGVGNAANENVNCKISVFGPEATEFTSFTCDGMFRTGATTFEHFATSGDRQSAADVDALRFHWSAGNWAAQGNIQFLGIAQ